ncbi:MAG: phosphatase PAP2 family protein [Muribaculaceae bacterium]|nr:phosphatase PAP2 family protein [Muribaculaceae bacterium]
MKIDTSDYYPYTPGHNDAPEDDIVEKNTSTTITNEGSSENSAEDPANGKSLRAPSSVEEVEEYNTPEEKAISRLANILSWVLVPMLVSVYATMILFNLSSLYSVSHSTKVMFTLIVFGFTALLPMGLVLLLKSMKMIQDIGLNGRQERFIPYLIMIVSYAGTAYFFHYKGAPIWVTMFYCGAALAAVVNMSINFRWKISAHAAAVAGVVAMLIEIKDHLAPDVNLGMWLTTAIVVSGLLGSARIWLGRHTLMQVLAGYTTGFLSVFLLMNYIG